MRHYDFMLMINFFNLCFTLLFLLCLDSPGRFRLRLKGDCPSLLVSSPFLPLTLEMTNILFLLAGVTRLHYTH